MIVGIDPSLTGCGVSDGERHEVISTSAAFSLAARAGQIATGIRAFIDRAPSLTIATQPRPHQFIIEGPALGSPRGASHLYEIGWLMCEIDRLARFLGAQQIIVQPSTLRKFVTGKGNTPKEELALRCFKRWGVEIAGDRGSNKLEAYCLHRYGLAVVAGEIAHVEIAKRGKGGRKKAS